MAARAAVQTLLEADEALQGLGVGAVYAADSVDTPGEDCFLVIRWQPSTWIFKGKATDRFTVWAHDVEHDYGRIQDVLERVKTILDGAFHVAGDDGWVLTQADWRGEGPDLTDQGYNTRTRYADFQAVSRYASPGA